MQVRTRSAAYPSYNISFCLELVKNIYSNYGSNYYAGRDEISKALKISVGHLLTQISSCVQYGLLELKSKEGYKVTDLFVKYHRPVDDQADKKSAIVEMFKSPPLYESLIELLSGDIMPAHVPLSNMMLHKFNIAEKVCEKAAIIFIENVEKIGLVDNEGKLNISLDNPTNYSENDNIDEMSAEMVDDEAAEFEEQEKNKNSLKVLKIDTKEGERGKGSANGVSGERIPFNIPLKGRRTAQIIIPNDVSANDFDTIINWIRLMKESFDE